METTIHTQCVPFKKERTFKLLVDKEVYNAQNKEHKGKIITNFNDRERNINIILDKSLDPNLPGLAFFQPNTFNNIMGISKSVYFPLYDSTSKLYEVPVLLNKPYPINTTITPPLSNTIYIPKTYGGGRSFSSILACSESNKSGKPNYLTPKQYLDKIKIAKHRIQYALIIRNKQISDSIEAKSPIQKIVLADSMYRTTTDTSVLYDDFCTNVLFKKILNSEIIKRFLLDNLEHP
jgi:hypothetical protein